MKRLTRFLLFFIGSFLLAFIGLCWFFSGKIIQPNASSLELDRAKITGKWNWGTTAEELMINLSEPEVFSLISEDEITIKGWYFQHPDTADCGVVMAHGWSASRIGMLKFADVFWDCGCDLVLYDHRMHGESGAAAATAGIKEKMDLIKVTEWLQKRKSFTNQQIAWVGESWGAATVLQAGSLDKDIAFIVADSPFQDWDSAIFERAIRDYGDWVSMIAPSVMKLVDWRAGVDHNQASPKEAVKNIKEPVFLIHSQTDPETASTQSVNIAKNLNPDNSRFHHTNWGSLHVQDIITRPEEYRALLYDFIQEEVGFFGRCGTVLE